ncbi:trypsin-like [Hemicordylus capensis]|uniref:trypsin-like n=1 Tax=Hemicordylus capensis TaxID=884348 RepID=UPI00230250AD|nr:trypsin-like [Hemicordylus capensis]
MNFFALFFAAGLLGAASSIEKGHIVGGYECTKHSVPWQVRLPRCGGSLINEWWVVTAAHCPVRAGTLVHLGKHDLSKNEKNEQQRKVAKVFQHHYNKTTSVNDIMLLKLAQKAQINKYVRPIKLPMSCPAPWTKCLISGWGRTNPNVAKPSKTLQCLNVTIFSSGKCKKSYPNSTDNMMCAGYIGRGRKSTCKGDSGGALVCNGLLQGIDSRGKNCSLYGDPTLYTKVCKYKITSVIPFAENSL